MSTHTFLVLYHIIGCIHGNPHSSKNLAVRGETFVCEHRGSVNSLLTDGSKNKWNYSIVIRKCIENDKLGILIKIQKVHSVGYVVVYFGDCKECDTLFNNFEVRIAVLPMDESTLCGHFDGIKHEPGQPLRVNCKAIHYENPIGYVGIRPNKGGNKGAISEVEVFALEYSQEIAYYGCFIDFEADKSFDFEYNNCKVVCLKIRKRFMSLMRNGTCLCGSKVPKIELPEEICLEIVCNTTSILCAVEAIYPLYIAMMPQIFYVGCYSGNSSESDLDTESNDTFIENMTPMKCLALCANRTMMYAYLKAESKCGCKFEIAERKISEQLCSRSCSGTELVHCGGPNGEANVYSGCITGINDSSCFEIYQCVDDNIDKYGNCLGACKDGYKGQYCIIRESILDIVLTRVPDHFENKQVMNDSATIVMSPNIRDNVISEITIAVRPNKGLPDFIVSSSVICISSNIVLFLIFIFVIT